jgi:hypothetical protein
LGRLLEVFFFWSFTLLFVLIWAPEVVGFVGALVVFFLLMVWVELGSVVVFGWVISVAIVLEGATRFSKSSKPSLIF